MLLFQEFEFEVVVRPSKANVGPNNLSRIDTGEEPNGIEYNLIDAHLFRFKVVSSDLVEIAQFLEEVQAPEGVSDKEKKILAMKVAPYTIVNGFLYKSGLYDVLR